MFEQKMVRQREESESKRISHGCMLRGNLALLPDR